MNIATGAKLLGDFNRADWEAAIAASAVSFVATMFTGAGGYSSVAVTTLDEAIAVAAQMGRKGMIYAINGDGHQTLVWAAGKPVKPGT